MTTLLDADNKEVIRIKVKKCNGMLQPEYKKLCVDPQLTSYEILQSLLARAFNIKGDFSISYLNTEENGQEAYLALLSDWDLDAAFLGAANPYLRLKVDLKPFEEGLEDWDIVGKVDVPLQQKLRMLDKSGLIGSITGTITSQVGKTVSHVTRAMGLRSEEVAAYSANKPPMADSEFHHFLDDVGHLIQPQQFRLSVYQGGVEPSLRKVVWRHLLNVYPEGMNGRERFDYLRHKVSDYYKLRDKWRDLFLKGEETDDIKHVTSMVKKDVLRTDRTHPFYSGTDDSHNVLSLFNLLVTYALTHPEVSYCQGMSDIASPILLVQNDEAHAYICFCGAMKRLRSNFLFDGEAMMTKFQHLNILLQHFDPTFHAYLKHHNADDMFFCYRWLLLELKREFPLDDALFMLEVMWSSLPPDPPEGGIQLADKAYYDHGLSFSPCSPTLANHAYLRLRSLTRHSVPTSPNSSQPGDETQAKMQSLPIVVSPADIITPSEEVKRIDPSEFIPVDDPATKTMQQTSSSIDRSLGSDTLSDSLNAATNSVNCTGSDEGEMSPKEGSSNSPDGNAREAPKSEDADEQEDLSDKLQNVLNAFSLSPSKEPSKETSKELEKKTLPAKTSITITDASSAVSAGPDVGQAPASPKRPSDIQLPSPFQPREAKQTSEDSPSAIGTRSPDFKKPEAVLSPSKAESPKSWSDPANSGAGGSLPGHVVALEPTTERGAGEKENSGDVSSCEEATKHPSIDFIKVNTKPPKLPSPLEFGFGNPFLMFVCLTLLLQHRDHIFKNQMDYNDMAMYFDKMVRKHNAFKAVQQAQMLFTTYIKSQQMSPDTSENGSEDVSV